MHFKCDWANKFNDTKDDIFYLTPNNQVTVRMMSLEMLMYYYHDQDLKFSAIQLPYKVMFSNLYLQFLMNTQPSFYVCIFLQDNAYSMIILLPDAKDGLKNLENNLSKIKIHEIIRKMTAYEVGVKLPRFKIVHSLQLKKTLTNVSIIKYSNNFD